MEWISVDDKLPDQGFLEHDEVIVSILGSDGFKEWRYTDIAIYCDDEWISMTSGDYIDTGDDAIETCKVTHWIKLRPSPNDKENQDGND